MHVTPRLRESARIFPVILAAFALIAAAWLGYGLLPNPMAEIRRATLLPQSLPLPSFALTDHRGESLTSASLKGTYTLLFFGFTNCPDVCPLTLGRLAAAHRRLAEAQTDGLPRILFVSVDPGRDSLERLARYVGAFDAPITAATGSDAALAALTGPLGIYYHRGDGEDYTVEHSTAVLLVNPAGKLMATFPAPHEADALAHDLALLLKAT